MPAIQVPSGLQVLNPLPVDFYYGPYANTAAAIAAIPLAVRYDGLTVQITGTGEYHWLQADLTDTGLIAKTGGGGGSSPLVRYVYLLQDASDVTLMGGAAGNAYGTAQAAYDAAVVIRTALGASQKVVIRIGNITAAIAGDITLTAAWDTNISLEGINKNVSNIGNIIATNASGTGFAVVVNLSFITVGNISTGTTGTGTFNGGVITLSGSNFTAGNFNTTSAATTGGNGGAVTLSALNDIIIGTITTSTTNATGTGVGGSVTITGYDITTGVISTSTIRATGGVGGSVTMTGSNINAGDVDMGSVASSAGSLISTGRINIGAITAHSTDVSTGQGGGITINGRGASRILSIASSSAGTGKSGAINLTEQTIVQGAVNTSANGTGRGGDVIIIDSTVGGLVTQKIASTSAGNLGLLTITRSLIDSLTRSYVGVTNGTSQVITFTNSTFSGAVLFSTDDTTTLGFGAFTCNGCTFLGTFNYTCGLLTNMNASVTVNSSTFANNHNITFNRNSASNIGNLFKYQDCAVTGSFIFVHKTNWNNPVIFKRCSTIGGGITITATNPDLMASLSAMGLDIDACALETSFTYNASADGIVISTNAINIRNSSLVGSVSINIAKFTGNLSMINSVCSNDINLTLNQISSGPGTIDITNCSLVNVFITALVNYTQYLPNVFVTNSRIAGGINYDSLAVVDDATWAPPEISISNCFLGSVSIAMTDGGASAGALNISDSSQGSSPIQVTLTLPLNTFNLAILRSLVSVFDLTVNDATNIIKNADVAFDSGMGVPTTSWTDFVYMSQVEYNSVVADKIITAENSLLANTAVGGGSLTSNFTTFS